MQDLFKDPTTFILPIVLIGLIIVMYRNSRKRKAATEELKSQIVPGANIMTNFGLFGTLVSIDEVSNEAEIEVSPGTIVRVHRQTIAKVVDPTDTTGAPRSVEEAMERANREAEERDSLVAGDDTVAASEPEFGERVEDEPAEKPVRRTNKKLDE